ncbi:MAG: type IV pilus secretin PilQ [Deltaproteobacteria bacterium]|nr:type IV pilus secretin PilQ [Deltaproteobacteria bacterium]
MRMQEQGLGAAVVKVVGVLLLGFLGCTRTLERPASHGHAKSQMQPATSAQAAPVAAPAAAPQEAVVAAPSVPPASAPIETPVEAELRVHEIRLAERESRAALVVRFSRPVDAVSHFALSSPNRVVIDVAGPVPDVVTNRGYVVSGHGVARVRVGAHEGKLRLVTDVEGRIPSYEVAADGRQVTVLLGETAEPVDEIVYLAPGIAPAVEEPTTAVAAAPAAEPAPAEPAAAPPPVAAPEVALPEVAPPTQLSAEPELAPEPALAAADTTIGEDESAVLAANSSRGGRSGRAKSKAAVASIPGGTIEAAPNSPREYTGQRISLDFKDADIQNVLRILADVSGLNIITTDDVQGKITMRLVEVPWDQALDSILKARGLDMVRDGNIIRVSTVEKLKDEREALRAANEAQAQAEPLKVRYIRVNYAKADEKFVKKVQDILTDRGVATWDERTNTIVVRDIDKGIADAEEMISHFDTQTPQILIEASIVEATENFARDLGIQWGYTYRAGPEVGNSTGQNFPGRVSAGGSGLGTGSGSVAPGQIPAGRVPFLADFPASSVAPGLGSAFDVLLGSLDGSKSLAARLTALEREGKGKIISRPRVVTLNNQAANIESLEILRVKLPSTGTVISTGAGGVAGGSQAATEQIKTGITLTVTPQLSSDGFVFLDVFAKSSALQPPSQSQAPSPDGIPNEISRQAESHVLIKDGETFVLGGVFRNVLNDQDNGVPYLRSIPVLGWAFKNTVTADNRQELLVFITPRSVRARGTEDLASLPSAEDLWQNRSNP